MDATLVYQSHGVDLSWLNQGNNWVPYKPSYHYDMTEASNHFGLDYTSILNVFKVLKHLLMLDSCMDVSLVHQSLIGGLSWLNHECNNWVKNLPL